MSIQWALLLFAVFAGMGMGLLSYIAYEEFKGVKTTITFKGLIVALILLGIGGLSSAFHMGHPEQVFYVLSNVKSGIAQELIGTVIAGITILAFLFVVKKHKRQAKKPVALIALVISLIFPVIMGHAYLMGARPAWNNWFLPLMFLGDALAMGWCLAYALSAITKAPAEELARTRKAAFIGVIAFAVTLVLWLVAVATAYEPAYSRSVTRILTGDLALVFWLFVVVAGIVLPLATSILGKKEFANSKFLLPVVGLLGIATASVAVRIIMYAIGTSVQSFIY